MDDKLREITEQADRAKIESELATTKKQLVESKKLNAVLSAELQKDGAVPPKTPKAKTSKLTGYARAIISDTHGCHLDLQAWSAVLADLRQLPIREVVHLGDAAECGGFLAEHHLPQFMAEAQYSYQDDLAASNKMFDELQAACPKAEFHYMEGNHEGRVEKWIMQTALSSGDDREMLRRAISPEFRLKLKERGIHYYRRSEFNSTNKERGVLKLGDCFFVHESSSAKNAAKATVDKFAANVCFGHTHRQDSATVRKPGVGTVSAYNPGCLCASRPLWQHSRAALNEWTHGYAVQLVQKDGSFLHINVPVIDGVSLLMPLTKALRS